MWLIQTTSKWRENKLSIYPNWRAYWRYCHCFRICHWRIMYTQKSQICKPVVFQSRHFNVFPHPQFKKKKTGKTKQGTISNLSKELPLVPIIALICLCISKARLFQLSTLPNPCSSTASPEWHKWYRTMVLNLPNAAAL